MKLLWVIAVCACWLAVMVQPERCMGFTNHLSFEKGSNLDNDQGADGFNLDSEQKVHITGFNGLCVSVKNKDYHNGNAIVLTECKDGEETQLWVMRKDQTIQSKEKCLTTYGYTPGDYVMIFDCNTAAHNATNWEFQSNLRRIINPKSELSLTARKDENDGMYYLVVDYHHFVPRQVWHPTNNTKPPVIMILDYRLLSLTLDGIQRVKMDVLDNMGNKYQRWAKYPDGTIRPEQHQDRCLRFEYGQHRMSVGTCGGWTNEPWIINRTIISHVATGMVMDTSVDQVRFTPFAPYLNCFDGSASQSFVVLNMWIPQHVSA